MPMACQDVPQLHITLKNLNVSLTVAHLTVHHTAATISLKMDAKFGSASLAACKTSS